ncbi:MAG: hypothetical protein GXP53_04860 [Deltaproteobacteria bacterium]|nr:hypothetical protein [Deltaproteobacteria bacterium]
MPDEINPDENPETNALVPNVVEGEVVEGEVESALSPREKQLVDDAARLINQTVKSMVLNASLRIGDHLLTVFFHNDIKRATSVNAHKNVSLSSLCNRPDISLDRKDLGLMIKLAAQERFIRQIDFNTDDLNYTHRKYLTRLPDGEMKINLVDECANNGMTTRQLLARIQEIENSAHAVPKITPERTIRQFITQMDRSMNSIAIPGTLSDSGIISGLPPDTRMKLTSKTIQWLEQMESIRRQCSALLELLENGEGAPP